MKIKFEDNERHILQAFLFKTRRGAFDRANELETELKENEITEEEFEAKNEDNEKVIKRVQKLINKFVTPSLFVKLKRNDVRDLSEIVGGVIALHESDKVPEGDKPHLTDESYNTCLATLKKLEAGMEHSMSQDR